MPNMKQTGTVNGNEFLRRRLGEDKNRTVKVDPSKFIEISEHNQLMEKKRKQFKMWKIAGFTALISEIIIGLMYINL